MTEARKLDHIMAALLEDVEAGSAWFEYVDLVHDCVPELNLDDVDLETEMLGYRLAAPIVVVGMTGGTGLATELNERLARAANEVGVAVGVGSQRAALERPELKETFAVVRDAAPDVPVIANIGASQLVMGLRREELLDLVEMVGADAVAVHLNPLHEAVQREGEPVYRGVVDGIRRLVRESPRPVIVKETGAGVSSEAARKLVETGIYGLDVGGLGGTSFPKVEALRSRVHGDPTVDVEVAMTFAEWGIPTAASILEVRSVSRGVRLIATGGIRSGLDMAKALRLGADYCGVALPLLRAAFERGYEGVRDRLLRYIRELRIALFLTGSRTTEELRRRPVVIRGDLKEWVEWRELRV